MWFARENIKDIRKVAQIIRVFCAHCSGQAFAQGFSTRVSQAGALLGKKPSNSSTGLGFLKCVSYMTVALRQEFPWHQCFLNL
jgi:hypothetical protein